MEHKYREESGLRFLEILIVGIIAVSVMLGIVVSIFGHFSYPDPGLL